MIANVVDEVAQRIVAVVDTVASAIMTTVGIRSGSVAARRIAIGTVSVIATAPIVIVTVRRSADAVVADRVIANVIVRRRNVTSATKIAIGSVRNANRSSEMGKSRSRRNRWMVSVSKNLDFESRN